MPSAVKKADKKHQTEDEPNKQALQLMEKRIKQLEKKKNKLDSFRTHISTLTSVQRDDVARYGEVTACIDQAKEILEQLNEVFTKAERQQKAKQKAEKAERQKEDTAKFLEFLRLQSLLDTLGVEEIREDFLKGQKGAVQLTETDLQQLDEFYQFINPTRDCDKDYKEQLSNAALHITNFLLLKEKPVAGTTYRKLKDLTKKVAACRYFSPAKQKPEQAVAETSTAAAETTPGASTLDDGPAEEHDKPKGEENSSEEQTPTESVEHSEADFVVGQAAEPDKALEGNIVDQQESTATEQGEASLKEASLEHVAKPEKPTTKASKKQSAKSFYPPFGEDGPAKPIGEVLASFKGNIQFLQDSEVDGLYNLENSSNPSTVASTTTLPAKSPRPAAKSSSYTSGEVFQSGAHGLTFEGSSFGDARNSQVLASHPVHKDQVGLSQTSLHGVGHPEATQIQSFSVPKPDDVEVGGLPKPTEQSPDTAPIAARSSCSATNLMKDDFISSTNSWAELGRRPTWGEESHWESENGSEGPPPIPMPGQALAGSFEVGRDKTFDGFDADNNDGFDGSNDQFMTVSYHSRNTGRGGRRSNKNRAYENNSAARNSNSRPSYEKNDRPFYEKNYDRQNRSGVERNDHGMYDHSDRGTYNRQDNMGYDRNDHSAFDRNDRKGYDRSGYFSQKGGGGNTNSYNNNYRGSRGARNGRNAGGYGFSGKAQGQM